MRFPTLLAAAAVLAAAPAVPAQQTRDERAERLVREVRHELLDLTNYDVFDHLAFKVDRGVVTLLGYARSLGLKQDAEKAVRDIPGVESVVNQIEMLPASVSDDRIRVAIWRAIFRDSPLERYALQAVPPIHVVVKHGRVTLEGSVATELDRTMAAARAREVDGVFNVTNNLRLDREWRE